MNKNIYSFGIALVLSSVTLFSGWTIHEAFVKKHTQQERNFNSLRQSRLRLESVAEYGTRFEATYPLITGIPDMLGLYRVLNLGDVSGVSPDSLELVSITNVKSGNEKLPLYEICIANTNGGFDIAPVSATDALNRAVQIDSRPDIIYNSLALNITTRGELTLSYDSLCILGRV